MLAMGDGNLGSAAVIVVWSMVTVPLVGESVNASCSIVGIAVPDGGVIMILKRVGNRFSCSAVEAVVPEGGTVTVCSSG